MLKSVTFETDLCNQIIDYFSNLILFHCKQADEFRAGLVNIPEGCTFISQTQETVNGVIKGEYTYEDPIGSQITVTYSVNVDGSNYVEKRKILKAYDTDGAANLLTAEEVVRQVSTELKPTIIQIIRTTVESANVDLNNYGNLVEVILSQLKPVVQACKLI